MVILKNISSIFYKASIWDSVQLLISLSIETVGLLDDQHTNTFVI